LPKVTAFHAVTDVSAQEACVAHEQKHHRPVVFIASDALLSTWRERATAMEDVVEVSDVAGIDLLEVITRERPQVVVLDENFACTDRGTVLIGRLRTTPEFQDIDIRVLWSESIAHIGEQGDTMPLAAIATSIRPSFPQVRRSSRRRTSAIRGWVDGHPITLIDLSAGGAQVLSRVCLRPDQRVQVVLADDILIEARVVWVTLELTPAPHHRAGLEFVACDAEALEKLIAHA
jgi:hypothetical protein